MEVFKIKMKKRNPKKKTISLWEWLFKSQPKKVKKKSNYKKELSILNKKYKKLQKIAKKYDVLLEKYLKRKPRKSNKELKLQKSIEALKKDNKELSKAYEIRIKALKKKIAEKPKTVIKTKEVIKEVPKIKTVIKEIIREQAMTEEDRKWPMAPILYNARDGNKYDVRSFISVPSEVLKRLKIGIVSKDTYDNIALKVLTWVMKECSYKSDQGEFWLFPEEMLHKKQGDCEDGTNLIVSICRNWGIPADRIKVACGFVENPTDKSQVGHSYPIYQRMSDNAWVALDWCYFANTKTMPERLKVKDDKRYKTIWFTYNNIYSWIQSSTEITGRVNHGPN